MTDGAYTLDTTYNDQLKSPMNMVLHWSEDALCWEVIVRYRGRRLGVTQVRNLDDLGQTVLDYLAIAANEALPSGALASSLHPKDYHAILGQVRAAIVHFGQLDRSNQTTALETIEQIDALLDNVGEPPAPRYEVMALSDQPGRIGVTCRYRDAAGVAYLPVIATFDEGQGVVADAFAAWLNQADVTPEVTLVSNDYMRMLEDALESLDTSGGE